MSVEHCTIKNLIKLSLSFLIPGEFYWDNTEDKAPVRLQMSEYLVCFCLKNLRWESGRIFKYFTLEGEFRPCSLRFSFSSDCVYLCWAILNVYARMGINNFILLISLRILLQNVFEVHFYENI